jgi:hypothetical protein
MASVSYTEQEGSITGENVKEPASGSLSIITSNLYWKFLPKNNWSNFVEVYFPLIPGGGSTFLGASFGTEYFFSEDNAVIREKTADFEIEVNPKFRYYATGAISAFYFSYETESSQKNDINVSLNLGGGAIYSLSKDYGIKADLSVGRGVGVITSTFAVKAFASFIYYWDR